jgi:hypothetical protein
MNTIIAKQEQKKKYFLHGWNWILARGERNLHMLYKGTVH